MDTRLFSGTRVDLVINHLRAKISGNALGSGSKLPSIRKVAADLGVSASTAVEAYDRLAAEGIIVARRGSGFFVAQRLLPFSLANEGPRLDQAVDPLWVSRQSLSADPTALMPGCGWLPNSWLPLESLQKSLRSVARKMPSHLLEYGTPLGHAPLRQLLAQRMADSGISLRSEQVILTECGSQAIDLVCRCMLKPGDTVIVDDPCYFNFQAVVRAHRVKIVSVPYEENGPDLETFEKVLREHEARLYITNSALHNPTGATLSPAKAHVLLKLAEQYKLVIVEDDIFADFEHEPSARLAAFDNLKQVVAIGSFSKTLSASIRCGYIACRQEWIEGLVDLKIATTFGSANFSAAVINELLRDGSYRKHVTALKIRLADATAKTTSKLKPLRIVPWMQPRGGMFLWCSLPDQLDATEMAKAARVNNVILAPGNVFSIAQTASNYMRFNVAQSLDPKVYRVLERAMDKSRHSKHAMRERQFASN